MSELHRCRDCNKDKPIEAFYVYQSGYRRPDCKSCRSRRNLERRLEKERRRTTLSDISPLLNSWRRAPCHE